jgi:hypothetical protein
MQIRNDRLRTAVVDTIWCSTAVYPPSVFVFRAAQTTATVSLENILRCSLCNEYAV